MNILITGSNGFVGKNLFYFLKQKKNINIFNFDKSKSNKDLLFFLKKSDLIIHTAGVNRSKKKKDFKENNEDLTNLICSNLTHKQKIIFTSSIQAKIKNTYGISKNNCEKIIKKQSVIKKFSYVILKIPNVFGKWSKPNYNSVIATFCYNIPRNKKITIDNPNKIIKLIYIDDLINILSKFISKKKTRLTHIFKKTYSIRIKEVYKTIIDFQKNRKNLNIDNLGSSFKKKLYSTYLSFIPSNTFSENMISHPDVRGSFQELLKSKKHGQVSCIVIKPGQERGNHFHFTKIERFFPIYGNGKFIMQNIADKKKTVINFSSTKPKMIETIPGYAHKIQNNTKKDIIVVIWTNEIYNPSKPDTYYFKI